jgi:hypothetical protein
VCRGSSLWFFELWIGGLCSLLQHDFCLGCVELLSLPKGSETCLLQVILLFSFFGFRSLVGFYFFSFIFPLITKMCVLSMHSSRGRLRAMCGSRFGGWSLPGVMSDSQRGVN